MKEKQMLDLYSDYLLASFGATTATGLSELLSGDVSHDQVTRYLSKEKKTAADLWRIVKPFVRKVQSDDGVLSIDDSIEEKPYTDEIWAKVFTQCVEKISEKNAGRYKRIRKRLRGTPDAAVYGLKKKSWALWKA